MGSFTKVALSFEFSVETPPEVLAAFSALASPAPCEGTPQLPQPNVEPWQPFAPDWREVEPDWREIGWPEGAADPFEDQPWVHDWARWVSTTMGGTTTPHGLLVWDRDRWHLDCRFDWKTWPEAAHEALSWLSPFVRTPKDGRPLLIGYGEYTGARKPLLFWIVDGRLELEDLNSDDDYL